MLLILTKSNTHSLFVHGAAYFPLTLTSHRYKVLRKGTSILSIYEGLSLGAYICY
jgi:hypothetical protein